MSFHLWELSRIGKSLKTKISSFLGLSGCLGGGIIGGEGDWWLRGMAFFLRWGKCSKSMESMMAVLTCEYTNSLYYWTVYLNWRNIWCVNYINKIAWKKIDPGPSPWRGPPRGEGLPESNLQIPPHPHPSIRDVMGKQGKEGDEARTVAFSRDPVSCSEGMTP